MKKITLSKSLTFFMALFCVVNFGFGQTTLSAGDIAITGFNADDPDQINFVLLKDITINTEIKFTDNGWYSTGGFRDTEGVLTWTATSNLTCGTEISITNTSGNLHSTNTGTAIETNTDFALSASGDQILVYQGTDINPTFIYGISFDSTRWSNATTASTSALPSELTNGVNAVNFGETDSGNYDCSSSSGTSLILAGISNYLNWTTSDNSLVLGGCSFSCSSCPTTVTWDGGLWSPHTPTLTTAAILNGNYDTSLNGSFSACSLTINSGELNIADNDYIEVDNELTVESAGKITVQPYGSFVQNNDTSVNSVSGTIEVEKETAPMNAWYEYTYWSSPVVGAKFQDAIPDSEPSRRYILNGQNFLDATAENNNDGVQVTGLQDDVDDNGDDWQWVNGNTVMQPGIGYATTLTQFAYNIAPGTSNKTFRFTFEGAFNNGIIEVPIYRNDSEYNDNNWNFIGNPYPSAIDADLFLLENSNVAVDIDGVSYNGTGYLDGAIFLWSQNTAPSATANGNEDLNFSDIDYSIINGTGETLGGDNTSASIISPSGHRAIPSGQGFFVSMSNVASATPIVIPGYTEVYTSTVTFNNSMRVKGATDNSMFFKNTNTKGKATTSSANKVWVNLTADNGMFNQTLIGYVNGATNGDDGMYFDATKYSSQGAALYTTIEGSSKKFAIQGKDVNSINEDEIINLGFKTTIASPTLYKLSVAKLEGDFVANNNIYLIDNLLNKSHNLSVCDYSFTSEVGEFNSRFEIAFTDKALAVNDLLINTNALKIIELQDDFVQFKSSNNLKINAVNIYDLLGRELYSFKGDNTSETYKLSNLKNTIYIAKIALSDGTVVTKKSSKK